MGRNASIVSGKKKERSRREKEVKGTKATEWRGIIADADLLTVELTDLTSPSKPAGNWHASVELLLFETRILCSC